MSREEEVRVIGIDPGSSVTGYGILEEARPAVKLISSGSLRTKHQALEQRLAEIFSGLEAIILSYQPNVMAIEQVFYAKNIRSALVLGHARGVALLAAARFALPVFEYPTRTVKQTILGHGGASKEQVCSILSSQLCHSFSDLDASDALAVAMCHLRWQNESIEKASRLERLAKKGSGRKNP